jgi:omega-6 fatty acid desaturase (delta-12 desaturase)
MIGSERIGEFAPRQQAKLFRTPSLSLSLFQLLTTGALLIVLEVAIYGAFRVSYWLVLGLAVPAGGLVVRLFIIQHDCGHGSFFRSRRVNRNVGRLCSLITLTPFAAWSRQHFLHHGNWNNLDRRESGVDIYSTCLTADEFRSLSRGARLRHRLLQNPIIALLLLPPLVFILLYRLPFDTPKDWIAERRSVWLTNLALLVLYGGLGLAFGFARMALVHLPIMVVAAILGVWLFSLQHRFQHAKWMRSETWGAATASLSSSSYLKLPRLLQWFTGNIGFHHIHHLDARVPNYRLEACHKSHPGLQAVPTLRLLDGLRAWRYALWDEAAGRMVRFRDVK